MNQTEKKGQTLFFALAIGTILARLITSVIITALGTTDGFREGLYLAVFLALFFSLYQGFGFVRWILIVLLGLGGIGSLATAFVAIDSSISIALWLVVSGVVYLVSAWLLFRSTAVRGFIAHQQARRMS